MNSLGGAPLTLIFEQSQIGGARHLPPPPLRAGIIKVTISYKHAHIDTQAQTCTQTNTDVLRSSWYFLGFLGGLIFHARPLLIFPRLFNLSCSSCWCHARAVAFRTYTKVPLFFLMALYIKQVPPPGARCLLAGW